MTTTAQNLKKYKNRAEIFKALAHPSRLLVVDTLAQHRKCVCELTELIGSDISTVSRHLSVLKNAGLIADEKKGTTVYYSLRVPCVLNFFKCVETALEKAEK